MTGMSLIWLTIGHKLFADTISFLIAGPVLRDGIKTCFHQQIRAITLWNCQNIDYTGNRTTKEHNNNNLAASRIAPLQQTLLIVMYFKLSYLNWIYVCRSSFKYKSFERLFHGLPSFSPPQIWSSMMSSSFVHNLATALHHKTLSNFVDHGLRQAPASSGELDASLCTVRQPTTPLRWSVLSSGKLKQQLLCSH